MGESIAGRARLSGECCGPSFRVPVIAPGPESCPLGEPSSRLLMLTSDGVSGRLVWFGLLGLHHLGLRAPVPGRVLGIQCCHMGYASSPFPWGSGLLPLIWKMTVLVAVSLTATREQSQPMFPSFLESEGSRQGWLRAGGLTVLGSQC